jgi:hypothetical protein
MTAAAAVAVVLLLLLLLLLSLCDPIMVGMVALVEFLLLSKWYKLPHYVFVCVNIFVLSPYFACAPFIIGLWSVPLTAIRLI